LRLRLELLDCAELVLDAVEVLLNDLAPGHARSLRCLMLADHVDDAGHDLHVAVVGDGDLGLGRLDGSCWCGSRRVADGRRRSGGSGVASLVVVIVVFVVAVVDVDVVLLDVDDGLAEEVVGFVDELDRDLMGEERNQFGEEEERGRKTTNLLRTVRSCDGLAETDHALELTDGDAVRASTVALSVFASELAVEDDELLRGGGGELDKREEDELE
jgi:hypothetical protein